MLPQGHVPACVGNENIQGPISVVLLQQQEKPTSSWPRPSSLLRPTAWDASREWPISCAGQLVDPEYWSPLQNC